MRRRLAGSVALVAAFGMPYGSLSAQRNPCAVDTTKWVFDATSYAWAAGLRGDVGVRERTAHINVSFDKVLKHLDGAFMLPIEFRKGRLGLGGEILYIKVSDDEARPGRLFTGASAEASTFMAEFGPRIRVAATKSLALDVLFGARLWSLHSDITLNVANGADLDSDLTKTWVDVIGGARAFYNFTDRWFVQARGDFGGYQAKFTWQGIGLVGYTFSDHFTARAGYRYLDVDYHDRGDQFLYDAGMGGPIVGLTFKWF